MKTYTEINNRLTRCKVFIDLGKTVIVRLKDGRDFQILKSNLKFRKTKK